MRNDNSYGEEPEMDSRERGELLRAINNLRDEFPDSTPTAFEAMCVRYAYTGIKRLSEDGILTSPSGSTYEHHLDILHSEMKELVRRVEFINVVSDTGGKQTIAVYSNPENPCGYYIDEGSQ